MTTDHLTAAQPAGHESRLRLYGVGDGRTELVVLEGELDMGSTEAADRAVDAALSRRPEALVLDLQLLEFCDCSGLRSLLRAEELAREAGVRLRLLTPTVQVARLLRLADCGELLASFDAPADEPLEGPPGEPPGAPLERPPGELPDSPLEGPPGEPPGASPQAPPEEPPGGPPTPGTAREERPPRR
ncbi:STAS domain-containing protein [Phaeacidiphilus oryzae]|uniref:STAS domain-containing protein n=1 Tax=Phaeacidiphilus oryzae TaxID=348818 RepID=UPI000B0B5178|nr:STAS domain-containing protein [Phaeacidiphilus oryzae]